MDINKLGVLEVASDYRKINNRLNRTLERLGSGQNAASPRNDPTLWGDIQGLKDFASKLSSFSDNLNRGATSVRVALDTMEATKNQLAQLEERLRTARALSPGSEDRARAMRDYNAFHRFIDDYAKAPDAGARKLLDNPATFPEAGDLVVRAGESGFGLTLRARPIHAGADGLNLPRAGDPPPDNPSGPPVVADPENATDEELAEMIGYLERAKEKLTASAKALAVDAVAIEESRDFNISFIKRNERQANELNIPDLNAEAMLSQSIALKSKLALSGLSGLNDTQRLALQLLK